MGMRMVVELGDRGAECSEDGGDEDHELSGGVEGDEVGHPIRVVCVLLFCVLFQFVGGEYGVRYESPPKSTRLDVLGNEHHRLSVRLQLYLEVVGGLGSRQSTARKIYEVGVAFFGRPANAIVEQYRSVRDFIGGEQPPLHQEVAVRGDEPDVVSERKHDIPQLHRLHPFLPGVSRRQTKFLQTLQQIRIAIGTVALQKFSVRF
mmetsp:Transcript_307/g.568  ORF Transcript_307/g.568 Transcript_307/m.568 type:complete len:204 (-) Transcript_307:424-1035(-)